MAGSGRSHPKKISLPQDQYILLYDISPRRPCCWFLFLFRFLIPSTEQRPRTRRRTTTCIRMMSKTNCLNLNRCTIYNACIMVFVGWFFSDSSIENQPTSTSTDPERPYLKERHSTRKEETQLGTQLTRRNLMLTPCGSGEDCSAAPTFCLLRINLPTYLGRFPDPL